MGRVTTVVGSVASVTGVQGRGAKLDRRKMCRKAAFPFAAGILSGILCSTLKFMQTYVDDDNWIEEICANVEPGTTTARPSAVSMMVMRATPVENLVFDSTAYGSFGTCMSFMIVFRTAQSYSRYWEGIVAVYEIMGYLFNAASNCLAFARITKAEEMQVTNFKRLVVRLFSLLFCLVLRELEGSEVSSESALKFPVLDPRGIDQKTRAHLLNFKSHSRPEQVYQAISKVILDAQSSGVINTPPPIVGRIYQEMGLGMRTFQCAMKLAVVDFPAPYLLALKMMLVVHMLLTPVAVISWATTVAFSGFFCFVLVFTMFGLMQLAAELDNPFLDNGFGFDKMILQQKLNKALVASLIERGSMMSVMPKLPGQVEDSD